MRPLKGINVVWDSMELDGWTTHVFGEHVMLRSPGTLQELLQDFRDRDVVRMTNRFFITLLAVTHIRPDAPCFIYEITEPGALFFDLIWEEMGNAHLDDTLSTDMDQWLLRTKNGYFGLSPRGFCCQSLQCWVGEFTHCAKEKNKREGVERAVNITVTIDNNKGFAQLFTLFELLNTQK